MMHRSFDGASLDDWSEELDAQLVKGLQEALSLTERKILAEALSSAENFLVNNEKLSEKKLTEFSSILAVLDEYIIDQAATVGFLIYKSSIVFERMKIWNRTRDSKQFAALGLAVKKAVERLEDKKADKRKVHIPIVDHDWPESKKQCVAELDHLFRRLSIETKTKNRPDLMKFARQFLEDYIAQHPSELPKLAREAAVFQEYVAGPGADVLLRMLNTQRRTPAKFYDEWMGWRMDRDPVKLAQKISLVGRELRNASQ
jgi:hypothetical protein